eukprot:TRINITY_DN8151_c0_g1_i6.p1 TRINITY_DN8151_c0_g1~~TRINITY_DN8151_c0_g1_i6.p1  ORF type:complete len:224 (-),score=-16.74 TRINITY_DN8151_c0_g1_i6:57-650(-)
MFKAAERKLHCCLVIRSIALFVFFAKIFNRTNLSTISFTPQPLKNLIQKCQFKIHLKLDHELIKSNKSIHITNQQKVIKIFVLYSKHTQFFQQEIQRKTSTLLQCSVLNVKKSYKWYFLKIIQLNCFLDRKHSLLHQKLQNIIKFLQLSMIHVAPLIMMFDKVPTNIHVINLPHKVIYQNNSQSQLTINFHGILLKM